MHVKTLFSYFQQFFLPKVCKTCLQADSVTNNQILVVKIIKIRPLLLFRPPPSFPPPPHFLSPLIRFYEFFQNWAERNFFPSAVFGGILLAGDLHSIVTMVTHVQAWQWIGSIFLLTWGLLWASACLLEVCDRSRFFLLLNSWRLIERYNDWKSEKQDCTD